MPFIEPKTPPYPHAVGTRFQLASAQRITGPFEIIAHTAVKHRINGGNLPAYTIQTPDGSQHDHPVNSLRDDIQPL